MNLTFMAMTLHKLRPNNSQMIYTFLQVLDFSRALERINITLAYKNESDIDFGAAEKKDGLKLLMTSAHKLSAPTKKKW